MRERERELGRPPMQESWSLTGEERGAGQAHRIFALGYILEPFRKLELHPTIMPFRRGL